MKVKLAADFLTEEMMQVHTLTHMEFEPAPVQIGEPFRCWECRSPDQGGMFLIIDHSPLEAYADHVYYMRLACGHNPRCVRLGDAIAPLRPLDRSIEENLASVREGLGAPGQRPYRPTNRTKSRSPRSSTCWSPGASHRRRPSTSCAAWYARTNRSCPLDCPSSNKPGGNPATTQPHAARSGTYQGGRFLYTEENMCQLLLLPDKPGNTKYTPKHKLLPFRERPVERVSARADACTIVELLAALLGGPQPIETADALLAHFNGRLSDLRRAPAHEIAEIPGIGQQNAARIKAAIELGLRLTLNTEEDRPTIHSPADAAAMLQHEMSALEQEHLRVILLDTRNRVIDIVEIYHGSLNSAQVRVAELFKPAIQRMSAAIILVHNHPSG
jgi:DNA repair protein RadC